MRNSSLNKKATEKIEKKRSRPCDSNEALYFDSTRTYYEYIKCMLDCMCG